MQHKNNLMWENSIIIPVFVSGAELSFFSFGDGDKSFFFSKAEKYRENLKFCVSLCREDRGV